jgi:hypothetical protein
MTLYVVAYIFDNQSQPLFPICRISTRSLLFAVRSFPNEIFSRTRVTVNKLPDSIQNAYRVDNEDTINDDVVALYRALVSLQSARHFRISLSTRIIYSSPFFSSPRDTCLRPIFSPYRQKGIKASTKKEMFLLYDTVDTATLLLCNICVFKYFCFIHSEIYSRLISLHFHLTFLFFFFFNASRICREIRGIFLSSFFGPCTTVQITKSEYEENVWIKCVYKISIISYEIHV